MLRRKLFRQSNWLIELSAWKNVEPQINFYSSPRLMEIWLERHYLSFPSQFSLFFNHDSIYIIQTVKFGLCREPVPPGKYFWLIFHLCRALCEANLWAALPTSLLGYPHSFQNKACEFCFCSEQSGFNTILITLLLVWTAL